MPGEDQETGQQREPNPFVPKSTEFYDLIVTKYKKRQPQGEARKDALSYGISELAGCLYETLIPDPKHSDTAKRRFEDRVKDWAKALEEAGKDEWLKVRDLLREEGRLYITAGGRRLSMAQNLGWEPEVQEDAATSDEKAGEAFINLANSLGVEQ